MLRTVLRGMLSPGQEIHRCSAAPTGPRRGGRWWPEILDHRGQWMSELQLQVRFGTRMRDAAVHSDATPKTMCLGVVGLCWYLTWSQTSPQLSGTPELLCCLYATKPFTLGVLTNSGGCQSYKPVVPALGTCCKPRVGGWCWLKLHPSKEHVPGANPPQEHVWASLEKSKLGQCSQGGEHRPKPLLPPWPDAVVDVGSVP